MSGKKEARAAATLEDPRWTSVLARDGGADGTFVYCVRTTGVYCRPSCGARTPRPENVTFHLSAEAAERAGFRPCKRCRPERRTVAEERVALVTQACRIIENAKRPLTLHELSRTIGLSPHHLHRVFKLVTGVTPRAYAQAQRGTRVRQELRRSLSITQAIFGAGYQSSSRFYEESDRLLGMTPTAYRAGGANTEIYFALSECSLGSILVAQSRRGICAILLGDESEDLVDELQQRFPQARLMAGDPAFEQLVAQVVGFIEQPCAGLHLPLDVRGTAFQQRVWQALGDTPPGQTASYGEIARRVGAPRAARAVARACAANVLAVAIPCHRVVSRDGRLSGYRWGVERKRRLLDRETGG